MIINTALLEQTMSYIETHPYEHNQQWWRCGSARCFAGWASFLAGGRFVSSEDDKNHIVASNGVKNFRADAMFLPDNSVADLRRMVDNLIEFGTVTGDPTPVEQWKAVAHQ